MIRILEGDCREVMATLDAGSVDAIVTDPPYELGFMGKGWDSTGIANDVNVWRAALRVLKPGGHLLAFSGTRTYHRMVCAIEDAGFEIRDQIGWVYGSGFPKSLDVSKAIDKAAGAEREIVGVSPNWRESKRDREKHGGMEVRGENAGLLSGPPVTDAARQWQGWGTALKPAWEPIVLARRPLVGTVSANVLQHGTGALNIDGCRVAHQSEADRASATPQGKATAKSGALAGKVQHEGERAEFARPDTTLGRWPANIILDGSDEVLAAFPRETGKSSGGKGAASGLIDNDSIYGKFSGANKGASAGGFGDSGSAARFFYTAKASAHDRNDGLHGMPAHRRSDADGMLMSDPRMDRPQERRASANHHPTVKPTDLMRYLCRLVTPPGGLILDPFMGSGSTLKAAELEGFSAIGIELDPAYIEIARRRIASDAPLFAEVA